MSVKFKKLAIASAVGATLGMAGVAQADNSLLFPYINTGATAFTFITVYQDPFAVASGTAPAPSSDFLTRLNLFYGYKAIGADPAAGCIHKDFPVQVSQGAILQWEVAGKYNLPSDFGDVYGAEFNDQSARVPAGQEGFLIIEYPSLNTTPGSGGGAIADQHLYGEAIVADTATGLAVAYTALNDDTVLSTPGAVADFTTAGYHEHVTSWYPKSLVGTTWYVLPVSNRLAMTPNGGGGIQVQVAPRTYEANIGAYSRNERYFSGVQAKNLTCFGTFGVNELFNDVDPFPMGGWMSVKTLQQSTGAVPVPPETTTAAFYRNALVWKLQQSGELGAPVFMLNQTERRLP